MQMRRTRLSTESCRERVQVSHRDLERNIDRADGVNRRDFGDKTLTRIIARLADLIYETRF